MTSGLVTFRTGGVQAVEHFDGTTRNVSLELPGFSGIVLEGIRAASSNSIWLVGVEFVGVETRGYVNHFDGRVWTRAPNAPTWLQRVRDVPGVGVISVGLNGGIVQLVANPSPRRHRPPDGAGGGAAGNFRHVAHGHVGGRQARQRDPLRRARGGAVPTGTSVDLADVWGTAPDDVWAVGQGGTVLHFDGNAFAPVASGTTAT